MDTENTQGTNEPSEPKRIILKPRRVDYPRRDRKLDEEYAEEISPLPNRVPNIAREISDQAQTMVSGKTMGYVGLAFGIASLFLWSVILGPIAAVIGYFAYGRGQKTTGAWAMGLGIVAALSYFVMLPFAR
ncbi:hypothetical protein [Paenibacillus wynnii]|uniref:hypothetical protein n=1 Tax=Paenibacillus wynnii TaxID=268407 RepID=UPI00278D9C2D|nr:hypothetical protein [Paenibacillus wynnii]MDQ0192611.1 hypothetical protein [Paenibacillus wynnii]